ncbi:MAG: GNAT family N-acetyltransferase [Nanoarchaeota archaeon]|nr:GNAT family N-acetyltransferase [Nanoarchaeota archaeon]
MNNPFSPFLIRNIPQELSEKEFPKYLEHLLELNKKDRILRFGYAISSNQIEKYTSSLNKKNDIIYGIKEGEKVIAAAHLAKINYQDKKIIELGISVNSEYRNRGLGSALFESATYKSRNQGFQLLETQCLKDNTWMMKKAREKNMTLTRDGAESFGELKLEKPDFMSITTEIGNRRRGLYNTIWDNYFQMIDPFSYLAKN